MGTLCSGFPLKMQEKALLQDSETQEFLNHLMAPALAHVPRVPSLKFYLVHHASLNAFTDGDPCIFLHTGLIEKSNNVGELAAVLFHELGHVCGHHVIAQIAEIKRTQYHNLIPALIGLMAAGVSQRWEAVPLGMSFGALQAATAQMGYSRDHEYFADHFALTLFQKLRWPMSPFSQLMARLAQQDSLDYPLYLRTHPFPRDRAEVCKKYYASHRGTPEGVMPKELVKEFQRVRIKILAFCMPQHRALQVIEKMKADVKAYGLSILAYREGRTQEALQQLKKFEAQGGSSPFTWELKAQILAEAGDLNLAIHAMSHAISQRPQDPLFTLYLAQLWLEKAGGASKAIALLERLRLSQQDLSEVWHWLGIAYGKSRKMGRAKICMAESAFLNQSWPRAQSLVKAGLSLLSSRDPYYRLGQDLKASLAQKNR